MMPLGPEQTCCVRGVAKQRCGAFQGCDAHIFGDEPGQQKRHIVGIGIERRVLPDESSALCHAVSRLHLC